MQFNLLGRTIEISEGRKNYRKIKAYYEALAVEAAKDFTNEYEKTFKGIILGITWHTRYQETYGKAHYLDDIIKRYVKITHQFLLNLGVYTLSESAIWKYVIGRNNSKSHPNMSCLQHEFSLYAEKCLLKEKVKNVSFIFSMNSAFSEGYFSNLLQSEIMSICDFVLNYLKENNVVEIHEVSEDDIDKADAIFKNLLKSNIPESEQDKFACSMIELNPTRRMYIEYVFSKMPHAKYEIAAIAKYMEVDLSALIEEEINQNFSFKSISCEKDALKMMTDLESVMEKFGVISSSKKTALEKVLLHFEETARTYDGVLYDTKELRLQAEKDDQMLNELHGDVSSIDKDSCKGFLMEIVHMQCTTAVKNKHLQLLNDRIKFIDTKDSENKQAPHLTAATTNSVLKKNKKPIPKKKIIVICCAVALLLILAVTMYFVCSNKTSSGKPDSDSSITKENFEKVVDLDVRENWRECGIFPAFYKKTYVDDLQATYNYIGTTYSTFDLLEMEKYDWIGFDVYKVEYLDDRCAFYLLPYNESLGVMSNIYVFHEGGTLELVWAA